MAVREKISVIIPVLDEEAVIAAAIEAVRAQGQCEVVVADGGSTDRTLELAGPLADKVVRSPRGRGVQLHAGAGASSGGILLFLHADCRLPEGAFGLVREALSRPGVCAGAFCLRIGRVALWARVVEAVANARSRLTGVPYGDQGLFMGRGVYDESGGFRPLPIMEDVEIAGRLKRLGRMVFMRSFITASPRRWLSKGVLMTTLRDWALMFSYLVLRVSPERLARYYGDVR
jgi:rSAM/selenodomain-associated transferase 2